MSDLGFKGKVPGAWRVPTDVKLTSDCSEGHSDLVLSDRAFYVPDALSDKDCDLLLALFAKQEKAPVAVSGYQTANMDEVGSVRATGWGPELATQLWEKLSNVFIWNRLANPETSLFHMNELTPTDWYEIPGKRNGHKTWIETGISPVLRFMEYKAGGKHNTHYDMGFDYEAHDKEDQRRTLMSIVWYLTEEKDSGGYTRFIEDKQSHLPIWDRNLDDWTRSANDDEVLAQQEPHRGGALIFWHRVAHDVSLFTGKSRVIIRGDIEFSVL